MFEQLVAVLSSFVLNTIESWGYFGIFILMTLEGSFVPIPSEVIMPFSGYLASQGVFSIWNIALIGALGNIVGTIFTYLVARYLGLPFLYKYGKFVLVRQSDIDMAHRLFERHGILIIFISRLLPGIRGFVPIPAGIAKMRLLPFVFYVFVGSYIWSLFLAYIGYFAGENWDFLGPYFHRFDVVAFLIVLAFVGWIIYRRFLKRMIK